jgi:hypothetical protein
MQPRSVIPAVNPCFYVALYRIWLSYGPSPMHWALLNV